MAPQIFLPLLELTKKIRPLPPKNAKKPLDRGGEAWYNIKAAYKRLF